MVSLTSILYVKNPCLKTNPSFMSVITQIFVLVKVGGKLVVKVPIGFHGISIA